MGRVTVTIWMASAAVYNVGGSRGRGTISASGRTARLRPAGGREYVGLGASIRRIRASIDVECPRANEIEFSPGDRIKLKGGTALLVSIVNVEFRLHCSITGHQNVDDDTVFDPGLGLEAFTDEWVVV